MIEDKVVFNLKEVAEYLNVHPDTVRLRAKRGIIPAFRIGAAWRFNKDSIDRWRWEREKSWAKEVPLREGDESANHTTSSRAKARSQ